MITENVVNVTSPIQLSVVECKRCHHKWVPRVAIIRICPACKSAYWNVERRNKTKNSGSKRGKC